MTPEDPFFSPDPAVGLCATCRHSRRVETPRSTFWLCERSRTDPSFEKYPRLPVRECPGYEPAGVAGSQ
jgi:hypothetical protein